MKKVQDFARVYQEEMGWSINSKSYEASRASLLNNYMLLTTEIAEVAEELRKAFNITNKYIADGMDEEKAFKLAEENIRNDLGKELTDCLAYIFKFANFFEIDMEDSFYLKMEEVKNRNNKDISYKNKDIENKI